MIYHSVWLERIHKRCVRQRRASLGWTAGGGCPYVIVGEELLEQAIHVDVALPAYARFQIELEIGIGAGCGAGVIERCGS